MFAELAQISVIIVAIVGSLLGLMGKLPSWKRAWNPFAAPVLGAIVTIAASQFGLIEIEMGVASAISLGSGWGAAAVGAHNLGKRAGRAGK